jgi:thioredoxin 1
MNEWTIEQWNEALHSGEKVAFYLYTPMCGTCAVASKMMEVIVQLLPDLQVGKANINFLGSLPIDYQVESVPCLLIAEHGKVIQKIYAFQSVPYLYEQLK